MTTKPTSVFLIHFRYQAPCHDLIEQLSSLPSHTAHCGRHHSTCENAISPTKSSARREDSHEHVETGDRDGRQCEAGPGLGGEAPWRPVCYRMQSTSSHCLEILSTPVHRMKGRHHGDQGRLRCLSSEAELWRRSLSPWLCKKGRLFPPAESRRRPSRNHACPYTTMRTPEHCQPYGGDHHLPHWVSLIHSHWYTRSPSRPHRMTSVCRPCP